MPTVTPDDGGLNPDAELAQNAATNARALFAMLGERIEAVRQDAAGNYPGYPEEITHDDLVAHFCGDVTFGISCVDKKQKARLLAFDVDERAPERIAILAAALEARGYENALIATTGSDHGRGKLLVFFEHRQPQGLMIALADTVLGEARCSSAWGSENPQTVESRPKAGSGGILRIGGRKRNGPLEYFFKTVSGETSDLTRVRPSKVRLAASPQPIELAPAGPFVAHGIENGWHYGKDGIRSARDVHKRIARLAHEAFRLYGNDGLPHLRDWLKQIERVSSVQSTPSPKTADRRNAFSPAKVEAIWGQVRAKKTSWRTLHSRPPLGDVMCADAGVDVMCADVLRTFVECRGLNPTAFQISYREIGRVLGIDHSSARRRVKKEAAAGRIVILHRGTRGERGLRTIFGLPNGPADVQAATERGLQHHMVKDRLEQVKQRELQRASRVEESTDLIACTKRVLPPGVTPAQAAGARVAQPYEAAYRNASRAKGSARANVQMPAGNDKADLGAPP